MNNSDAPYEATNIKSSSAHTYRQSSQDKYIDPKQSKEISDLAKKLENTPDRWNINNALALKITKGEVDDLLNSLYILKSPESRVYELRSLLKGIIEGYLESLKPSEYLTAQHRNVLKFIHTGCWYDLRIAKESAFLLYTLGPFGTTAGPTSYIDVDHQKYRTQVQDFCMRIHKFYLQRGRAGNVNRHDALLSEIFPTLGDELRRVVWQNQVK